MQIEFNRELTTKEKSHIAKAVSQLTKVTAKSNEFDVILELLVNLIK